MITALVVVSTAIAASYLPDVIAAARRLAAAKRSTGPTPEETPMLDTLLSPASRARIYGALSAVGAVLVLVGVIRQETLMSWLGVANALLGVAGLLVASWHARRFDMLAIYTAAAVAVAALQTAGVLNDGTATRITTILAALTQVLGLALAYHRTDATTPTGEPAAEFAARLTEAPRESEGPRGLGSAGDQSATPGHASGSGMVVNADAAGSPLGTAPLGTAPLGG